MPGHAQTCTYSPTDVGRALANLRAAAPLVQCLTNAVATGFTANVLLAVGASPAMVDVPGEAAEFTKTASAVLINVGTPQADQRRAMLQAARAAHRNGTVWVLDPVAVGATDLRTRLAESLLAEQPTVIRGNASEILALAGTKAGGRGTDATDDVEATLTPSSHLAAATPSIVAVSGGVDLVTDSERSIRIHGGDRLLTRITGGGCALGALVAAAVAANPEDPLLGTVCAHALFSVAAQRAAVQAAGPGSFAVGFLDALSSVGPQELSASAVIA